MFPSCLGKKNNHPNPEKKWHKAKGTIKFPRQNSKKDGDSSMCKAATVKVIGINLSGNSLAHHG